MTINVRRRLRISIATLGLFVAGALCADRVLAQGAYSCLTATSCVPMTLTANLQLTNLHPTVTHVQVLCTGKMSATGEIYGTTNQIPVVNRGYTGSVTTSMNVPLSIIAASATHSVNVSCKLQFVKPAGAGLPGQSVVDAVASATGPQELVDSNWAILATGATVNWSQSVTFPNVNPVP